MSIATTADVEARWRPLSDEETTVAETRLEDAERNLRRRIKDFAVRVETDEDFRADVVQVEADAVIRVLLNPDRKSEEKIDDYAFKRGSDGGLRITADEWATLGVVASKRKAFMLDTTPTPGR